MSNLYWLTDEQMVLQSLNGCEAQKVTFEKTSPASSRDHVDRSEVRVGDCPNHQQML
jgi:hypothetical protein